MNYMVTVIAAAFVIAGCSTGSEPAEAPSAARAVDCRNVDAPTGSRLVRRSDCAPAASPTAATPAKPSTN